MIASLLGIAPGFLRLPVARADDCEQFKMHVYSICAYIRNEQSHGAN